METHILALIVSLTEQTRKAEEFNWDVIEKVELPPLEEFRPEFKGHGWKMLIR